MIRKEAPMTKEQLMEHRISYFKRPAMTVSTKYKVSIANLFEYIVGMHYTEETWTLRSIKDDKERKAYKAKHFDFVTFSGLFSYRKDDCLVQHSGLMCLDFDHLGERRWELRNRLIEDPYFETELLFTSPSGDGLKWVVEIDIGRRDHRTWFRAIQNYVRQTYHEEVDEKCINESRACFLPHDSSCYVNPILDSPLDFKGDTLITNQDAGEAESSVSLKKETDNEE